MGRSEHLKTGEWGEKIAAVELKKKKYRILGKRVRLGNRDELDIVARDGDTLVFVEVKTRKTEDYGAPSDAVDKKKRANISRAVVRYLNALRKPPEYFRFDVVEVIGEEACGNPTVRHIKDAFTLDNRYSVDY